MKDQIKAYLNRYVEFSDDEIDVFYSHLTTKTLQKKQYLLRAGEVCASKYFILKGLLRSYYVDDKYKEKITQFGIENWWVTNLESFVRETPSHLNIQAVEASILLTLNKRDLETLYASMPKLERFFRLVSENMLIAIQRKNDMFMPASSRQRYQHLVTHIPNFAQRVPQYMIASYLEITPEHLSSLRKDIHS